MGVQHVDHTVRATLSHPTSQGRWAQQLGKIAESCVRRMHEASLRTLSLVTQETSANLWRKECQKTQRGPAAPRHKLLVSRAECHKPWMWLTGGYACPGVVCSGWKSSSKESDMNLCLGFLFQDLVEHRPGCIFRLPYAPTVPIKKTGNNALYPSSG